MRHLRDDLFHRMEALPIKYFDTHAHGDIMSVYTNDVDTLRQLLSQSIPQIINSSITMVATLVTMMMLNPALTVISILSWPPSCCWSPTRFLPPVRQILRQQQQDLGMVDGFIEEMLDGQKVVKVFCHEEAAMEDFHKVNEALRDSADKANRYANLLMPVNANIGWLSYASGGHRGRHSGHQRTGRRDPGHRGHLCGPEQELYPAHHPGEPAGQLRGHGPGRRPAGL